MAKLRDYRSDEAKAYRHLYWTPRWRALSRTQRRDKPLCERCLVEGRTRPAQVAHHVIEHKGDPELFWNGELQSLCHECHSSDAAFEERRGYGKAIDDDGWPSDAKHPSNHKRS